MVRISMKPTLVLSVALLMMVSLRGAVAQEAPLFRQVGPRITGGAFVYSGNNTASAGPRDALYFGLAPAVTEVFHITNEYYSDYTSLATPTSAIVCGM
jgi:hypothetical protein